MLGWAMLGAALVGGIFGFCLGRVAKMGGV